MKHIFSRTKILSLVVITILFVSTNLLISSSGWVGGLCIRDLTGPSEDDHPMHTWTDFGLPLTFLQVTKEGCFDNQVTHSDFYPTRLLIDVVAFIIMGIALNYLLSRRQSRNRYSDDERFIGPHE